MSAASITAFFRRVQSNQLWKPRSLVEEPLWDGCQLFFSIEASGRVPQPGSAPALGTSGSAVVPKSGLRPRISAQLAQVDIQRLSYRGAGFRSPSGRATIRWLCRTCINAPSGVEKKNGE